METYKIIWPPQIYETLFIKIELYCNGTLGRGKYTWDCLAIDNIGRLNEHSTQKYCLGSQRKSRHKIQKKMNYLIWICYVSSKTSILIS